MRQLRGHPPGQEPFSDSEYEDDSDIEPVFFPGMELDPQDGEEGEVIGVGYHSDDDIVIIREPGPPSEEDINDQSSVSSGSDSDYIPGSDASMSASDLGTDNEVPTTMEEPKPITPVPSTLHHSTNETLIILVKPLVGDKTKHHRICFQWNSENFSSGSSVCVKTEEAFKSAFADMFSAVNGAKLLDCKSKFHDHTIQSLSKFLNLIKQFYADDSSDRNSNSTCENSPNSELLFQQKLDTLIEKSDFRRSGLSAQINVFSSQVVSLLDCGSGTHDFFLRSTNTHNSNHEDGDYDPAETNAACQSPCVSKSNLATGQLGTLVEVASRESPDLDCKMSKSMENAEDLDFCNPMISEEEAEENAEAFRGDRIGSTMYCERHVIKLLMELTQVSTK